LLHFTSYAQHALITPSCRILSFAFFINSFIQLVFVETPGHSSWGFLLRPSCCWLLLAINPLPVVFKVLLHGQEDRVFSLGI
jgi:hypothetical protein